MALHILANTPTIDIIVSFTGIGNKLGAEMH